MNEPLTLEQLSEQFVKWRMTRKCRTAPFPKRLRQHTVLLLLSHSKGQIARTLSISGSMLNQWIAEHDPAPNFVKLPVIAPSTEETPTLTCQFPNGIKLTFTGVVDDRSLTQLYRLNTGHAG